MWMGICCVAPGRQAAKDSRHLISFGGGSGGASLLEANSIATALGRFTKNNAYNNLSPQCKCLSAVGIRNRVAKKLFTLNLTGFSKTKTILRIHTCMDLYVAQDGTGSLCRIQSSKTSSSKELVFNMMSAAFSNSFSNSSSSSSTGSGSSSKSRLTPTT